LLQSAHRGYGLFNDLFRTAELNIMGKQQIDIIGPQSRQRLFEALSNFPRGEIEVPEPVAPAFRCQANAFAPALQSFPEPCFRKSEAVVRGNIEEVDPLIYGQVD